MSTTCTSPLYPDRSGKPAGRLSGWIAALVFTVLTAAFTWPQVLRPLSVPPHDDAYFSMWRIAWIAHQLPRDPLHLFDANILYPEKRTLAYSDAVLVQGLAGAPFIWLGAPVVLVYNAQILATFVLCGLGAFLLVRDLSGRSAAGLVAGAVFAFATYRFDHYVHLELLSAQWMPFALWMLHRTLVSGRLSDGLWTGAFGALQGLSSVYFGIFFATIAAVLAPLLFWSTPSLHRRRALLPLAAGALLAAAVLGIYALPYRAARSVVGERAAGEQALYAAGPKHYMASMPDSLLYGDITGRIGLHEKRLFPGFAAMLLTLIALWPPLDRRRVAYGIALAIAVDISFGHRGILGAWLQSHVGVYGGLRVVARIGAVVLLLVAVLAGFGFARLLAAVGRRIPTGPLAGAIALIILAEYAMRPMVLERVETQPGEVYRWLREQPPGVVAEFPLPASWKGPLEFGFHESRFTYNSSFHWKPMVNGYSGFWPASYVLLSRAVEDFPSDGTMRELARKGVAYLLLHERFYSAERYRETIRAVEARGDVVRFGPFKEGMAEVRAYRLVSPAGAEGPGR